MSNLQPTYRQLDHWTTRGYLRPQLPRGKGTGRWREWPAAERRIAAGMVFLTKRGFTVQRAADLSRRVEEVTEGTPREVKIKLGEDAVLVLHTRLFTTG